ncbi:MAG: CpsD/CapB family tyrosine-protein kinase [Clostridia bacterium]|nr:CpsD/CapB family tyrosine-protein kinase [Clostridia bacterium]
MSKSAESRASIIEQRKTLHTNLNFAAAEAYKMLRTNIFFSLPDDKKCHIIGVTSSVRGEGKSTTAINLSYSLAEAGKKVLLIDADMRLPSIAKKMEIPNDLGLSDILVNAGDKVGISIHKTLVHENWHIITSGSIPPNPSELLGSGRMKKLVGALSEKYDFIVVDLPPVTVVTDATILSPVLDGIAVVVKENSTDKRALNECVRLLKMSEAKILGFIMTSVKEDNATYRKYGSYYGKHTQVSD